MSVRVQVAQWQGFYYLATALWALCDLDSFQWVTGPKTDLWLVKTVGLLVGAIGLSLIVSARRNPSAESRLLGITSAAGLFFVDCWYAWRDVISPIYLFDAAVEAALLVAWSIGRRRQFRVSILRRTAPYW